MKVNKYRALAAQAGAKFCAFVVERFGGVNKAGRELIEQLALQAELNTIGIEEPFPGDPSLLHVFWSRVMLAVHRGNAQLVQQALQSCATFRLQRLFFSA